MLTVVNCVCPNRLYTLKTFVKDTNSAVHHFMAKAANLVFSCQYFEWKCWNEPDETPTTPILALVGVRSPSDRIGPSCLISWGSLVWASARRVLWVHYIWYDIIGWRCRSLLSDSGVGPCHLISGESVVWVSALIVVWVHAVWYQGKVLYEPVLW